MQKRAVFFSLLMLSTLAVAADSVDEQIIKGKKMLAEGVRKFDEKTLLDARAHFEKLLPNKEQQFLTQYFIGYTDYRLAILYRSQEKSELQIKHIDDGISNLYSCLEKNEQFADGQALLSSLLGLKISADPQLGMTLGPEAGTAITDAVRYGKDNPRVALFSAMTAYFTPEEYGGSKTRAIAEMKRAAELFKNEKLVDKRLPDWGHNEAHLWLARMYMETDQLDLAKQSLDEAVKIDPEFAYAKTLQTRLQEKVAKK
ncbi:MAG TPA: tetratricopeptide repeat protein [bacterium]